MKQTIHPVVVRGDDRDIAKLNPDWSATVDWSEVRKLAKEFRNKDAPCSRRDQVHGIAALLWAVSQPGVAP